MIQIDMEMPKCYDECFALDDHGDYPFCLISQDQRGYTFNTKEKRMPTCPLKAQDPRVMTIEEVKVAAGHDVWLELSGNLVDDVLFAATIEGCGTKGLCTRYESLNYSAYGIRPYGWRCWTARPTDEQREAVKWE